jgi:hypothetical protein
VAGVAAEVMSGLGGRGSLGTESEKVFQSASLAFSMVVDAYRASSGLGGTQTARLIGIVIICRPSQEVRDYKITGLGFTVNVQV